MSKVVFGFFFIGGIVGAMMVEKSPVLGGLLGIGCGLSCLAMQWLGYGLGDDY